MPKETRLDESAEIYNRNREHKTEKEKWSEMNWQERYEYFKSYYLLWVVVTAVVVVLVGAMIYNVVKPKPEMLVYAAVLDYALTPDMADTLEEGFSEHINLDPKTQELYIDTSFTISTLTDFNIYQKFAAMIAAKDIDVMIGGEAQITSQIQKGALAPLSELLPTELYTALEDHFVYGSIAITDTLGNITGWEEEMVYGLSLEGCSLYEGHTLTERPIIGIVVNSEKKENAVELIKYLFDK